MSRPLSTSSLPSLPSALSPSPSTPRTPTHTHTTTTHHHSSTAPSTPTTPQRGSAHSLTQRASGGGGGGDGWIPRKEGYLMKRSTLRRWTPRYFVLESGVLVYFAKYDAPSCQGSIKVHTAVLSKNKDPSFFQLDTGSEMFYLQAEDSREARSWIDAIQRSQQIISSLSSHSTMPPRAGANGPLATLKEMFTCLADQKRLFDSLATEIHQKATNHNKNDCLTKLDESSLQMQQTLATCLEQFLQVYQTIQAEEANWDGVLQQEREYRSNLQSALSEAVASHADLRTRLSLVNLQAETDDDTESFYDAEEMAVTSPQDDDFESAVDSEFGDLEHDLAGFVEGPPGVTSEVVVHTPNGGPRRTSLPVDKPASKLINLWNLFKDAVGKDITRITVPVVYFEPSSFLQRMAEDVNYPHLLDTCVGLDDPLLRMVYVVAFAVSGYSGTEMRTGKPFNPLLGETFHYHRPDLGFQLLCEQVSHHPPIGAMHCVGSVGWNFHLDCLVDTKFWGKSIEVHPMGSVCVDIPSRNERYTWNKVTTTLHNVLLGEKWIEHHGDMCITNHSTGDTAVISFLQRGWWNKQMHSFTGKVISGTTHKPAYALQGKWNSELLCTSLREDGTPAGKPKCIWEKIPLPPHSVKQYNFTKFTMELNELRAGEVLPPTDSRLRPDLRALENGDLKLAGAEKHRLEEKQRATRKMMEKEKRVHVPKWFEKRFNPETKEGQWTYRGGYFEGDARVPSATNTFFDIY